MHPAFFISANTFLHPYDETMAANSYISAIICCIHDYKWNNEFINAHTICYIMTMHIKRTFIALGFKCAHLAVNTHIYDTYLSYRQAAICYFITDSIHVHIFFHILIITWLLLISINLRVHGK